MKENKYSQVVVAHTILHVSWNEMLNRI